MKPGGVDANLKQHLMENQMHYSQAVYRSLDSTQIAFLLAGFGVEVDGKLVPDGLWMLSPWYLNIFENITTVQFNHRMVAYLLASAALIQLIWLAQSADDEKLVRSAQLLVVGIFAQAALGIWTLLAVVPLWLGLTHQGGAAVVLILAVRHAHFLARAPFVREAPAGGYPVTPSIS